MRCDVSVTSENRRFAEDAKRIRSACATGPKSYDVAKILETITLCHKHDNLNRLQLYNKVDAFAKSIGEQLEPRVTEDKQRLYHANRFFNALKIGEKWDHLPGYLAWLTYYHPAEAKKLYNHFGVPFHNYVGAEPEPSFSALPIFDKEGRKVQSTIDLNEIREPSTHFIIRAIKLLVRKHKVYIYGAVAVSIFVVIGLIWHIENSERRSTITIQEEIQRKYQGQIDYLSRVLVISQENGAKINHMEKYLRIPRDAIIHQLVKIGANKSISIEEVPGFLSIFAENYQASMKVVDVSDLGVGGKLLVVAENLSAEGRFAEASEKYDESTKVLTQSHSTLSQTLAEVFAKSASTKSINFDDFSAYQDFLEAARYFSIAKNHESEKYYTFRAAASLIDSATGAGSFKNLLKAIELLEGMVSHTRYVLKDNERVARLHMIAKSKVLFGNGTGDNEYIIAGTSVMREAVKFCETSPSINDCTQQKLSLAEFLQTRGTRSNITYTGRLQNTERMKEAVDTLGDVVSLMPKESNNRIIAQFQYARARLNLALQTEDSTLNDQATRDILAVWSEMERRRDSEEISGSFGALIGYVFDIGLESEILNIEENVKWYEHQIIKFKNNQPYSYAGMLFSLSLIKRALYKKSKNTNYIREALNQYEEALSIFDDVDNVSAASRQIDYGLLLYEYGVAFDDPKFILKSIVTSAESANTSYNDGRIPDILYSFRTLRGALDEITSQDVDVCFKNIRGALDRIVSDLEESIIESYRESPDLVFLGTVYNKYRIWHIAFMGDINRCVAKYSPDNEPVN